MINRGLVMDIQHVVRRLRRAPAFSVLAIGTLGLGIGATTAIFSLAHAIWLNPLSYGDPDRLVAVYDVHQATGQQASLSGLEFEALREGTASFTDVAAYGYGAHVARIAGEPVRIVAYRVTPNLFRVLDSRPALGRTFADPDVGMPVVVLSDATWRSRFHGDPAVVGHAFELDAAPYTVIGVMPPEFHFPQTLESEIWTASGFHDVGTPNERFVQVIARLRPGFDLERAQRDLALEASRLAQAAPASNAGWTMRGELVVARTSESYRAAFTALLGMVGLFLLIACANLASLLIARNMGRRAEMTLATALGATRWRLVRGLVVESLIFAGAGAVVGLLLTAQANGVFASLMPSGTPRLSEVRINPPVLIFACAVGLLTAVVCAVVPAFGLRSLALSESLSGARSSGPPSLRAQNILVVIEVALAALLLVGASLMLLSFADLIGRDRGYQPHGVLALNVTLPFSSGRYQDMQARLAAFDEIFDRIAHVPGARVVGATTGFPGSALGFLGGGSVTTPAEPGRQVVAGLHNATPDYFRAMGVPLKSGRAFLAGDSLAAPHVAIVNDELAARLFPGGQAVGQHLRLPPSPGLTAGDTDCLVVGIVGDMHLGVQRFPEVFVPLAQAAPYWIDLVVRTDGDPQSLRDAARQVLRRVDPDLLIENVASLDRIIWDAYGFQRAESLLTGLVASLASVMAAMGIYSLLAHYIAVRTREMGICLALGSSPRRLFWQVFRRGMTLAIAGTAVGVGSAVLVVRAIKGQVFGLQSARPATFILAGLALTGLAALVMWWSARRVVRIDPLIAIRQA